MTTWAELNCDIGCHLPTPAAIREACEAIQRTWTEEERVARSCGSTTSIKPHSTGYRPRARQPSS